jgi:hypothetical protein
MRDAAAYPAAGAPECNSVEQVSGEFSAAAADAFDLGVQELVALIRRSLGVGVIAVATIARELRSVHAVATEAAAKSVNASCIGRERQ